MNNSQSCELLTVTLVPFYIAILNQYRNQPPPPSHLLGEGG
ncbi:hypothetical protein SPLC1_S100590 [Arthrospira platensis C1]|nr:hypothetical protein SPLC1_S100590 [Arthrospira platensis C1]